MRTLSLVRLLTPILTAAALAAGAGAADRPTAVTGVSLPQDFRNWTAVAPSHRTDKDHIRMMLANDIMASAYREKTLPFPDGATLAKLVYKAVKSPEWADAVVPGEPVSVEIMPKDSAKYPTTGGWGFGRFSPEGQPLGDAGLYQTCFPCHQAHVVDHDYIFTRWAP